MVILAATLDDGLGWVRLKRTLWGYCFIAGPPLAILLYSFKVWFDRWRESIADHRSAHVNHA